MEQDHAMHEFPENTFGNAPNESSCAVHFLLAFCFCLSLVNLFLVWRMAQKARAQTSELPKARKVKRIHHSSRPLELEVCALGPRYTNKKGYYTSDEKKGASESDIDLEKGELVNPVDLKEPHFVATEQKSLQTSSFGFDGESTVAPSTHCTFIASPPSLCMPSDLVYATENGVATNHASRGAFVQLDSPYRSGC